MKNPELVKLEMFIARLLRVGVAISGVLMLAGWLSDLHWTGNPLESFRVYQHAPFAASFMHALMSQQWGLFLSYIGLVILVSLPLLRVLMTAVLFLKQRDYLMAAAATVVFAALIVSFSMGFEI